METVVVQADASRKKATSDLNLFCGVPDGMTGIKLFDHQIAFRQRAYARKPHEHRIDPALRVEQKNLLSVDNAYKVQGDIMQAVGDGINLKQAVSSRLNNIGNIKAHSAFVNDPKSLQRMQEKWLLAKSMGTVSAFKDAEVKSKNNARQKELYEILPIALDKYQNNEHNKAFTKGMMKAILVFGFGLLHLQQRNEMSCSSSWLRTFSRNQQRLQM